MSRPDTVSVLASGWSAKGLDLTRLPGLVIGVNSAAIFAPRVDEIVTMDRLWAEHYWPDLCRLGKPTWMRGACLHNIPERPAWLQLYMCDWQSNIMSGSAQFMNGTNSGMVALNRAFKLQPKRVVLFGFDMGRSPKGEPYWHPPHPWRPTGGTSNGKYAEWARQFDEAAKQFAKLGIEVLNASPVSKIPAFAKVKPEKVLV